MVPIHEQGNGKGIGHSLKNFLHRFDAILKQHKSENRACAFAFIFYDFNDAEIKILLKDQGVFTRLDRLAGADLSVFYLHAESQTAAEKFNGVFLRKLGLDERTTLPCVVFFRLESDRICDINVAQLDNANLMHGLNELLEIIQQYKEKSGKPLSTTVAVKWVKSVSKFLSVETLRAVLREGLSYLMH